MDSPREPGRNAQTVVEALAAEAEYYERIPVSGGCNMCEMHGILGCGTGRLLLQAHPPIRAGMVGAVLGEPGRGVSRGAAGKEAHHLHSRDFALKGVPILVGAQSADALKRLDSLGRLQRPNAPDAHAQHAAPPKALAATARSVRPDAESMQCSSVIAL